MANDVPMHHMDYLVALAQERHFARAALRCNISQPTLSLAIQRLERQLGIPLVRRDRRFEGFTDEGQRVVAWAKRIVADRNGLLAEVDRMREPQFAPARIGSIPTALPASSLLISEFLNDCAETAVRVEAMSSADIYARIKDYELDVGIDYLPAEAMPGMQSIELYRESYVLVAPKRDIGTVDGEVDWGHVCELRHVALMPSAGTRDILDSYAAAQGRRFRPSIETDSVRSLFDYLADRGMSTIASTVWLHAFDIPAGFAVRRLQQLDHAPRIGLLVLERSHRTVAARALAAAAARIDFSSAMTNSLARHGIAA